MHNRFSPDEERAIRDYAGGRGPGQHRWTCPSCSSDRRNRRALCLSLSVEHDRVLASCHHCEKSGAIRLTDAPSRSNQSPIMNRAVKAMKPTVEGPAIRFLASRQITQATAEIFGVTSGVGFFPDLRRESDAVCFPYFKGTKPAGHKLRATDEKAHICSKPLNTLFAAQLLDMDECPDIIIAEGECLTGDAEVLTPRGWVRLADYEGGKVAQWKEDRSIEWVDPIARVVKPYQGDLYRFSNRFMRTTVTPGHRMPGRMVGGKHRVLTAQERFGLSDMDTLYRSGFLDGEGIGLSRAQIAFCLAISADAAIDVRKNTYRNKAPESRYARVSFSKERKIERFVGLLEGLGLDYVRTVQKSSPDMTFFGVHLPEWVPGKMLPWEWIEKASSDEREFILDELIQWDGNRVRNRTQTEYSSKHLENAEWVQAMAHTAGRCSTIMERDNRYGRWLKVSILNGKAHGSYQNMRKALLPHDGNVYCVTVPSGMFLVREGRSVCVTGNCDVLSFHEAGVMNAVSVPNGASSFGTNEKNASFLWEAREEIEKAKRVIIAADADDPGEKLAEELARRIGKHKCWKIEYPEGCKDANDVLMRHGGDVLRACVENAVPWPVAGLYEASHYFDMMESLYTDGYGDRIKTGLAAVDEIYSVGPGLLTVVTGVPGYGKTTFINQLMLNVARLYGYSMAICSFENPPEVHTPILAEMLLQKHFFEGKELPGDRMSMTELRSLYPFLNRHFKFLQQEDGAKATLESLIERIKTAVFRWGVKGVVIDPYNYISRPANIESETQFIDDMLTQLRLLARALEIHIWFVAHTTKLEKLSDNSYRAPGGYDISGSAAWFSKTDIGMTIHQNPNSPGVVQIIIWKSRFAWIAKKGEKEVLYDTMRNTYISDPTTDLPPYEPEPF